MLEFLPTEKLTPAPDNPRKSVGDVAELAASIAAAGILEPLIVTPDASGGHLIVAGARRFAAAKEAGLAEVPCIVREMTDEQRILAMAIENLQRVDLLPLLEAAGFSALASAEWSQRRIAKEVGRSQAHVSKRMALLELPEPARAAVDSGVIGVADAQELLKLKDAEAHGHRGDRGREEPPPGGLDRSPAGPGARGRGAAGEGAAGAPRRRRQGDRGGPVLLPRGLEGSAARLLPPRRCTFLRSGTGASPARGGAPPGRQAGPRVHVAAAATRRTAGERRPA